MNEIEFTVLKTFTSEFKLRTNPLKAFNGMCVQLTSITFPVMWSSVLISVTQEWCYCRLVYKFFLINNIELKCSFVRCRKYHKSQMWSNGAAELHISVDLFCGTMAAELHNSVDLRCDTTATDLRNSINLLHISVDLLCGTTAAELHNSVHLLCDTTAAELRSSVDLLCDTMATELHNSVSLLWSTMAAELNLVWCMHQESQTSSKETDESFWKIWRFNPK